MAEIKLKRVYDPASPSDGVRVLVDRLWPRGMKKEALRYDIWAKEAAPSSLLRTWFHSDPDARWEAFRQKYREELTASPYLKDLLPRIAGEKTATLLYAARDPQHNHAVVLRDYIEGALK